jgi:UDP-N-acetyl-2-amino-2-deoxyglucuronate dehydrogenase
VGKPGGNNMNFGLIGAAGFVAPRHMVAIKETGHELKVALDPNDSVGILDRYFPECKFFTQVEKFDRHIVKYEHLDYIVVCTPNYLHESHCKLGMRLGANVICEKPLATTVENALQLQMVEEQTKKKIYSILQLRLHPAIKSLRDQLSDEKHLVDLRYITPRGPWYFQSWKGKERQSGGIETNIGIHFFDILIWLFGNVQSFEITERTIKRSVGVIELERANVVWFLSLDRDDLPDKSKSFYRRMIVDGNEVEFDSIFSELHTESYKEILAERGFGIEETLKSIELVSKIRELK